MGGVVEGVGEMVEACVCTATSAAPFIVMGLRHVSVAVEVEVVIAATSSTLGGVSAGLTLVFSFGGPVMSGDDGMLGWCAVSNVSASGVEREIASSGARLGFGRGLYEPSAAFGDEHLRICSASRSHVGVSSSSGG